MRSSGKLRLFITPRLLILSIAAVSSAATGYSATPSSTPADAIYYGGPIITIDDAQPSAEAVAIRDGRILAVGGRADVEKAHRSDATAMIDLRGGTMLPGFVDGHSHFSQVGILPLTADLLPPPDGTARSIPDIQRLLRDHIAKNKGGARLGKQQVVVGMNYDDSMLN